MLNIILNQATAQNSSAVVINKQEIDTLVLFLSNNPSYVGVRPLVENGVLHLKVAMSISRESEIHKEMQIPADDDLVSSVIYAMSGDIEPLEKYKESEHKPKEYVDADKFKQEIFEALLETNCPLTLKDELENCKGEHYVTVSFRIAYKKNVNICLKKTKEVEDKIKSLIAKEDIA
jgi:hypothetical protein